MKKRSHRQGINSPKISCKIFETKSSFNAK